MSKYVFCDLDYTLLNNNKEVSNEDFLVIKDFEAKGNHFIINSGRAPFALKQYTDLLNSTDVITSNGALIISKGKIIKKELLSKETVIPIIKYAAENNMCLRIFTDDYLYILNKEFAPNNEFMYEQRREINISEAYNLIDEIEIIKVAFSGEKEKIDIAKTDIMKMQLKVELSFSSDYFLEINSLGQNKGNGIKDYCKLNNINIKDTISIGDNDNDISMLKVAGYSACPSNAIKKVKEIVNYVCINDNNHNAIKEILEKIN